jgi:hypothetical protein
MPGGDVDGIYIQVTYKSELNPRKICIHVDESERFRYTTALRNAFLGSGSGSDRGISGLRDLDDQGKSAVI